MRTGLARSVALAALANLAMMAAGAPTARAAARTDTDAAADADAGIRRGVELRRQGKDQEALEEFRKAYGQTKTSRALAQVGLAEQALGRWAPAEADLEMALGNKADPWIQKNSKALLGALDVVRRHLGSFEVIGLAGAELRVDGRVVGILPLKKPVRLPIGSPIVELRRPGFFPATRPISIAADALTRESIELQPIPTVAPIAGLAPASGHAPASDGASGAGPPVRRDVAGVGHADPAEAQGQTPADEGSPNVDSINGGAWHRPLAWATAVGAVVAAGGGVAALLVRSNRLSAASSHGCIIANGTVARANNEDPEICLDYANTASQAGVAAVISFSAAGALAIASGILFATAPRSADAPATTTAANWMCAPAVATTMATAGVTCHLRF